MRASLKQEFGQGAVALKVLHDKRQVVRLGGHTHADFDPTVDETEDAMGVRCGDNRP